MLAPTRRAAPVTSAALPVSALPAAAAPAGGSGISGSMGDEYERIRVTLNPPAAVGRGRAPQPRARCAHARGAPLRRRLAVVRALHGARSLHARPRVLQRGQRQDRPGRGLRDRSRGVGSVRPLPGAPVRGDSRAHRRGDSRARGRHRADGRGASRRARRAGRDARALRDTRSQRRSRRAPAPEPRTAASGAARARRVARAAAGDAARGSHHRQRGGGRAPLSSLPSQEGKLRELGVALAEQGAAGEEAIAFREQPAAPDAALARECERLLAPLGETLPDGYASEVSLRLGPWIASLGECLGRGVLLLADYGLPRRHYYHPQRVHGTLRCHFKQRAHDDPYINVGVQDITAWVDFTRVAEAAVASGLEVLGFATQTAFLLATDIESLIAEATGTVEHARRAGEARRLLMPGEMGEAFKVMALA